MQTTANQNSPMMDVLLDQRLFLLDEQQFQAFEEALYRPLDATQQQRVSKLLRTSSPWELCGSDPQ